ncbi:signal recognition particle, SRP19 subunit [Amylostereum chailletii]|nr:signal recognition particle, SRP19 subunit [Amylostereum chailletii]
MSRRAPIIEEFDDDVDLPLPSRPLPDHGARGPLLMEISDDDDASSADFTPPPRAPGPTPGPASPFRQEGPGVTDITPYKKWTCIYPIYIDAKRPYGTGGRRISRAKSVWWPLSKDIADACSRLGLGTLHEVSKTHPSDWENPGRVRVQWKKEGRLVNSSIKTKKQLLEMISIQIQGTKVENIPKQPYNYPAPIPPPTAKPAKSKQSSSKSTAATAKSKSEPKPPPRTGRPLAVPPEPMPGLASRVSTYSPALESGVLLDTVKAGMSAQDGPGAGGAGAAASSKGKRKVVRVRQ